MTNAQKAHLPLAFFLDLHPDLGDFRADVIAGLSLPQKQLSPKYFYDERGSRLFQQITALDEYYPTRTERSLFETQGRAIARAIGSHTAIFEYGAGASEKIEWLIDALDAPVAYVAMDISKDHLLESLNALAQRLTLPIAGICADFYAPVEIPESALPAPQRWTGYFPGSTIGNMSPDEAVRFLTQAHKTLGPAGKFLLGVDRAKKASTLIAAYDDAAGVTAQFNLNLLRRIKRELDATLDLDAFEHSVRFDEEKSRIEMHLRATRDTAIDLDGLVFPFRQGETLHTENSYKYSAGQLDTLIGRTPWRLAETWSDASEAYSLCLLEAK